MRKFIPSKGPNGEVGMLSVQPTEFPNSKRYVSELDYQLLKEKSESLLKSLKATWTFPSSENQAAVKQDAFILRKLIDEHTNG